MLNIHFQVKPTHSTTPYKTIKEQLQVVFATADVSCVTCPLHEQALTRGFISLSNRRAV